LEKLVLPIKKAAQPNTCSLLSSAHGRSDLPFSFEESSLFLGKARCYRNDSVEMNQVLFRITATFW